MNVATIRNMVANGSTIRRTENNGACSYELLSKADPRKALAPLDGRTFNAMLDGGLIVLLSSDQSRGTSLYAAPLKGL